MTAFSQHIGSLLNGVSRQSPQLRLTSQGEEQINGYSTLARGLGKRPPFRILKVLGSVTGAEDAHFHLINRDSVERYVVLFMDQSVRVFDLGGNEKVVNFPDGTGYLDVTNARKDFAVVTVADNTFVVNRTITVAGDAVSKSPARNFEALINIEAGNYGKTYAVDINGVNKATFATPDGSVASHSTQIDTVYIATQLYNALVTNGINTAPWSVTRYQNAIHISNTSTDFAIALRDGFNGNAAKVAKGSIQKFTDLPPFGPDGFAVEITGDSSSGFDDYWVKLKKKNVNDSSGVWVETIKPDTLDSLDAATMPHSLVREANGTFTFKKVAWGKREVGDTTSSPDPAFVGQKVRDVVFHRNRMGLVAGENVTLSRSTDFFNFFTQTLTTSLDSDPIDIGLSTNKVATVNHAVPLSGELILFADQTQVRFSGGELLTPKTASAVPLSDLLTDPNVRPIVLGSRAYFIKNSDDYATVWEYWISSDSDDTLDQDTTSHVPDYIPSGVSHMAGNKLTSTLFVKSDVTPDTLYFYKFLWTPDNQKPQNAWSKWAFPVGSFVVGFDFVDSNLILYLIKDGVSYLGYCNMEPFARDEGMDFQVYLDYRVSTTTLAVPSYDDQNEQTTYTLPYDAAGVEAWVGYSVTGELAPGTQLGVISASGNSIVIEGDTRDEKVYFGRAFEFNYQFSDLYFRDESGGQSTPITDRRTQILRMLVNFGDTGAFTVEVQPQAKGKRSYGYSVVGAALDNPDAVADDVILEDGTFAFPVKARNTAVDIFIKNNTALPCWFVSADYIGQLQKKHSRG